MWKGTPYLTMVCSAMAGPEVRNSRDAVNEARVAPDRCRMCLAQRPVFQRVGSAAGTGLQWPQSRGEDNHSIGNNHMEGEQGLTRASALRHSQPRHKRPCCTQNL